MGRIGTTHKIDTEKLKECLKMHNITATQFAESLGLSPTTLSSCLKGLPITESTEDKITRGLFKPTGFFRLKEEVVQVEAQKPATTTKTDTVIINMGKQLYDNQKDIIRLLEDIKQEQEATTNAIKTMSTLVARLLALWEGEKK